MGHSVTAAILALVTGPTLLSCRDADAPAEAPETSVAATDAADGEGDDGAVATRYRTFLMVERWVRSDPAAQHTIAALQSFRQGADLPRFAQVDAHCGYHEGDWRAPDRLPPSFGTVKMEVPSLGEVTWTETEVSNAYEPAVGLGWDSGDRVKVVAAGGDLPGFTLEDTVPAEAHLTSHDLAALQAGALTIPRGTAFDIAWDPVGTEVFALFLQFDDASYLRYGVLCFFPGAAGAAAIPPSLLAHLQPTSEVKATNFYFAGASRKSLALEGADLEMVTWKGRAARVRIE